MLDARSARAIEMMKEGAEYVCRLERDSYTNREQFKYHLLMNGKKVRGFGIATFYAIKNMLVMTEGGTSVSTYYKLRA